MTPGAWCLNNATFQERLGAATTPPTLLFVLFCVTMTSGKPEQRSLPRISAQVQVSIRSGRNETKTGLTRDLSRNGVFFYTDSQLQAGSDLEMVLMLPPELSGGEKQWVCCQATVVRVEETSKTGQVGVGANIRNIATLPEIPG